MSGVRSSKTVNGVSYEYTTLSGKITRMTWSGNAVDIVYDDAGRPYILRYTPSGGATQTYYYVLNLQGDVVGLMNTSMQMVVKYSYDPWGKLTGTTATSAYVALAQANPLRYRSYCYDIETGFYYLQTRYYDPAIARFINADGYLSTGTTGLLSYNMFAYCENNPVMYSDIGGSVRNYCVNMTDGGSYRVYVQLDDNFYVPNDNNVDKAKEFYNDQGELFDDIADKYGSPNSSYYLYYKGKMTVDESTKRQKQMEEFINEQIVGTLLALATAGVSKEVAVVIGIAELFYSGYKSHQVADELKFGQYDCYTVFVETPCEIDGQPATKVQIIELYYVKYDTSVKYSGEYAGVSGTIYR